jgi:integrase
VISGVMGQAVRHGAIMANPVREVERIEAKSKREPRALTMAERVDLLQRLQEDEKARRRDLPDLVFFMLATGVRIGEALAVVWSEVDFDAGTVKITSTLIRVKGEGLLRKGTKSRAGERTLPLPESAVASLRRRFMTGARLDQPVFPSVDGGFRDRPTFAASCVRPGARMLWRGLPRTRSARRRRRSSMRLRCLRAWSRTSSATAGRR